MELFIHIDYIYTISGVFSVLLQPRGCICPNDGYTCQVNLATEINWITNSTTGNDLAYTPSGLGSIRNEGYFRVNFTHEQATRYLYNFTSTLIVTDFNANGTNVTCEKFDGVMATDYEIIVICIVGM